MDIRRCDGATRTEWMVTRALIWDMCTCMTTDVRCDSCKLQLQRSLTQAQASSFSTEHLLSPKVPQFGHLSQGGLPYALGWQTDSPLQTTHRWPLVSGHIAAKKFSIGPCCLSCDVRCSGEVVCVHVTRIRLNAACDLSRCRQFQLGH